MKNLAAHIFCLGLASFAASNAMAFPLYGSSWQNIATDTPNTEASPTFDFRGIVSLSNCSGSIVRFDDSTATDRAMVLSNGHCVGLLKPGVVLHNQSSGKTFAVLSENAKKLGSVSATKIIYATMTRTDVSLFLLQETYQEIETKFSIQPLTLARTQPSVGTNIEVISGYWKRGFACSIESNVATLREGDWTFVDSLRYSRPGCEIIGGTSGSPVIAAGTRNVIAVNNTVNENGQQCEVNNPCEVNADGSIFAQKGYGYAQQTFWFYSCRDEHGQFDLSTPGCRLPK